MGINFYNPNDRGKIPNISWGYLNFNGDLKDLSWFENVGRSKGWAIEIEEVKYDKQNIQGSGTKTAYIDTGSHAIQLPKAEFDELLKNLKEVDDSVSQKIVDQ